VDRNHGSRHRAAISIATLLLALLGVASASQIAGAGIGPHAALPCSAHVSSAHPAQYSDVTVSVTTRARAHVTTIAHYRTTDHAKSATANAGGHAAITYDISDATKGYRVVVSVTTALKGLSGHCSTAFTPR